MPRLVVFDLDGTLIDSRRDLADAANAALVSCGGTPLAEELIGRMVGDGAPVLVARVFATAGLEQPPDAVARFLSAYSEGLLRHTVPYDGIRNVLDTLERRATLAMLTNKPLQSTRRILDGLDLARYFRDELIVGGDGPFARKPDPAGLRHLVRTAGVEPHDAVLVGDSSIDYRTARQAETRVCLARYGFGWEGFPVQELDADAWVVDEPVGILNICNV